MLTCSVGGPREFGVEIASFLKCLQLGVAANVLAVDENIGHRALAAKSFVFQSVLDFLSIWSEVELDHLEIHVFAREQALCRLAVGAE